MLESVLFCLDSGLNLFARCHWAAELRLGSDLRLEFASIMNLDVSVISAFLGTLPVNTLLSGAFCWIMGQLICSGVQASLISSIRRLQSSG